MTRGLIHGTTTAYAHYRCRCPECRAAVAEYQRKRKQSMNAGTWAPGTKVHQPERCSGPGCGCPAQYLHPQPLCGGHHQQVDRGVPLSPLRRKRQTVDGMKECRLCARVLPVESFYMQTASKGQRQSQCIECASIQNRAQRYGITFAETKALIDGGCTTCGSMDRLHIDHDHVSGGVRGALCHNCNTVLTKHMTPERLRRLAAYLEGSLIF